MFAYVCVCTHMCAGSQSVTSDTALAASPENLELQVPGSYPRPMESKTEGKPRNLYINNPCRGV